MKLHLVALPHTEVSKEFCGCAYTSKILKFCKMLGDKYNIYLYAPEGPDVPGAKLIPCLSYIDRLKIFGADDTNRLPEWPSTVQSELFNKNVIKELRDRIDQRDLILLTGGLTHSDIAMAFPQNIKCEPGVGYEGILTNFCAFESYAWMHWIYSRYNIKDGRWFDCVIPNYFDPDDFIFNPETKHTYLLFLGRLIARKGPHIAAEIAEAAEMPLLVAGAGGQQDGDDIVTSDDRIKNATYIGPVDTVTRAKLLSGAYALICPTIYMEPFGGVAIEAMMSGTPVIASDWGAFTETVISGRSGFRFRTLADAKDAVSNVAYLNRTQVRIHAMTTYSLTVIGPRFDTWFKRLQTLWDKGWYQLDNHFESNGRKTN